eukprot:1327355-Alexandrium_andersonii.AAC.1
MALYACESVPVPVNLSRELPSQVKLCLVPGTVSMGSHVLAALWCGPRCPGLLFHAALRRLKTLRRLWPRDESVRAAVPRLLVSLGEGAPGVAVEHDDVDRH